MTHTVCAEKYCDETQGSEQPETCAYCKYLAEKYDGWEPWEDVTWD